MSHLWEKEKGGENKKKGREEKGIGKERKDGRRNKESLEAR